MEDLRALAATLSIGVAIGCVVALIDYRRVDRVVYLVTIMLANNLGSSPEVEETLEAARQDVVIIRPLVSGIPAEVAAETDLHWVESLDGFYAVLNELAP